VRADEHHQQELERQMLEHDMNAAEGQPDYGNCDGCGYTHPVRVTTWTVEGFRIRFGDAETKEFLKMGGGFLPGAGECASHEEAGYVSLCHECEYHPENWMQDYE